MDRYEGEGDYKEFNVPTDFAIGFLGDFAIGFYGFCNLDFVFVFYKLLIPI